ncbi:hypothetical protein [Bacillus testis]|uniref:hypothetical protein n=1 Tax=Bacillus testis TaxID=1622072 RepID=UPI00067EBDC5|nr:hypothetical protein [Bacillus testis]
MDHVINSLKKWLDVFEDDMPAERDVKAIECINSAINELEKYYNPETVTWTENYILCPHCQHPHLDAPEPDFIMDCEECHKPLEGKSKTVYCTHKEDVKGM